MELNVKKRVNICVADQNICFLEFVSCFTNMIQNHVICRDIQWQTPFPHERLERQAVHQAANSTTDIR